MLYLPQKQCELFLIVYLLIVYKQNNLLFTILAHYVLNVNILHTDVN